MAQKKTLVVELVGDDRSLSRALNRSEKGMGKWAKKAAGFGAAFGTAGAVIGAAAVREAREAEKVGKQTDAALRSTGKAAKVTRKEIEGLSNSLSMKSGIDDEAIQSAQNMLLSFTKLRNEVGKNNQIFSQASTAVVDVAARMAATGGRKAGAPDLKTASIQIGKALNDPIKGLTSLTRVGVQFDAQQRKQIQTMVSQGNTLGAQKVIMRELRTEFGGSAAANADGMDRMKVAIDNMLESLGGKMLPTINAAANSMARFLDQLRTGQGVGGRVAAGFRSVTAAISGFVARNRETFKDIQLVARTASRVLVAVFRDFTLPGFRRIFAGLRQMWSGFAQSVRGVVRIVSSIIRGDFRGVMRGMRDIVAGAVRGMLGVLRAFTAPFRQAAVVIGKNVVGGLVAGIRSAAGAIADAGKSLGRTLLNAAKDFLGISSPSKEFMKVGGHVVSGFAKGLSAGNVLGVVKKHFGGMAKFATNLVTGGALKAAQLPLSALSKIGGLFGGSKIQGGIGSAALVGIGRRLQGMGFQVGEHPSFGPVGKHAPNSYHYRGRAIDVNWPGADEPGKLDQIHRLLRRVPHKELLWRTEDHYDHLHLAMRRGGTVPGKGSGDRTPAMLEPGEGIINRKAVAAMGGGPAINAINRAVPRFQSGGMVSNIARWAKMAGFREGKGLKTAIAVALAESGGNVRAYGDRNLGGSHGLWQIHRPSHQNWYRQGIRKLYDPVYNARAAFAISSSGSNWRPWTTYNTGAYKRYMGAAGAAIRANRKGKAPRKPPRRDKRSRKPVPKRKQYEGQWGYGTEGGATFADVAEMHVARAALTPSLDDDITAARLMNTVRTNEYTRAVQSGDPRKITAALQNLGQSREALFTAASAPAAARNAFIEASPMGQAFIAASQASSGGGGANLADEIKGLREEMRLQRLAAERAVGTGSAVAWKALADIMSGQIGNTVSQRKVAAGDGRVARF